MVDGLLADDYAASVPMKSCEPHALQANGGEMLSTIATQGATLRVLDSGGGSDARAALVFLHYWGGSAATWRKVIADLPDVRCVALNQRGWGGSAVTDGRYDLGSMAKDVLAIIQHLGLRRVVLVGHSMGGKVARIVAKERLPQILGLVLVAPAPPTPMPVPEDIRRAMLDSYQSVAGVAQALANLTGPSFAAADRQGVTDDTLAGDPGAKREWTDRGMISDLGIGAGDIDIPVTLLLGALDKVENPDRLREIFGRALPQARFVEIAGTGHLSPLEAPEAIASACRDMLAAQI